jgi:hypothetical protein
MKLIKKCLAVLILIASVSFLFFIISEGDVNRLYTVALMMSVLGIIVALSSVIMFAISILLD